MHQSDSIDSHRLWKNCFSLLLVLGCILAYSNTLDSPFILDDDWNISKNQCVRDISIHNLFVGCPDTGISGRPLATLTFGLNFWISGEQTWSYHLLNLIIHILSTLTLFGICTLTFSSKAMDNFFGRDALILAFFCAAIWSLHPMQTQAVTYITQRLESMMGLCFLTAFYFAIRGWQSKKKNYWHALSIFFVLLGVGAKEVIVAAPLIFLVYDYLFVHHNFKTALKRSPLLYCGLMLSWVVLGLLVMTGRTSDHALGATNESGSLQYLLTQPKAIIHYLANTFWPNSLSLDHGNYTPQSDAFKAEVSFSYVLAIALSLTIVLATVLLLFKRRYAGFALFWFLVILAPTSSILPLFCPIEEHRMYLPLAGIVVLVVTCMFYIYRHRRPADIPISVKNMRRLVLSLFSIAIIALGIATYHRNQDYVSGLAIWQDTVQKNPQNPRAHSNLSIYLARSGQLDQAVRHARIALEMDPNNADTHINLGCAYKLQGRREEAMTQFLQSLRLDEQNASAHYNIAEIYDDLGSTEKALFHYRRSLQLDNLDPRTHTNYAQLLSRLGRIELAIQHYQTAIKLSPSYHLAYNNLGLLMLRLKRMDESLALLKTAVALKEDFAPAYHNLGYALFLRSQPEQAIVYLKKAVALNANNANTHLLMIECYLAMQNNQAALSSFAEVRRLDPDLAQRISAKYDLLDRN